MRRALRLCGTILLAVLLQGTVQAQSQTRDQAQDKRAPSGVEPRLALVIGEADYAAGPLRTGANDAGMIAQSLAAAGFDVSGYADLDATALREAAAAFVAKARAAGSDATVFVYLAGYGVQYAGDNFIVPVDARIARDIDVPAAAVRLSDLARDLAATPLKARIVVTDLARATPFAGAGTPLARGLALIEPAQGLLSAANAAPGAVAALDQATYGLYAQALSEMMQVKGLPIEDLFSRVRARVTALTGGGAVPWNDGTLDHPFALFPPVPDTPASANLALKPAGLLSPEDAFWAAILRDTLQAYAGFLKTDPDDPAAPRIRMLLAVRREALTFAQAVRADTAPAYWTYMRRYPRGPHFADVRRRLAALPAALEPPPRFELQTFADLPAPGPDEMAALERPAAFDAAGFAAVASPSSAVVPARRAGFYERWPPLLAVAAHTLPLPLPIPLGFVFPRGRIIQPDVDGRPGPVTAIAGLDAAGNPTVTQLGPDAKPLSKAALASGPDGTRTLTQSGPEGPPVATWVAASQPDGRRTVTERDSTGQVITVTSVFVEPNGNQVTTLSGPDGQAIAVMTTTPNGMIVPPRGVPPAASRASKPQVILRSLPPAPAKEAPLVVSASPQAAAAPKAPLPTAAVPSQPLVAPVAPKAGSPPAEPVLAPLVAPVVPTPVIAEPRVPDVRVPDVTITDVKPVPPARPLAQPKPPAAAMPAGAIVTPPTAVDPQTPDRTPPVLPKQEPPKQEPPKQEPPKADVPKPDTSKLEMSKRAVPPGPAIVPLPPQRPKVVPAQPKRTLAKPSAKKPPAARRPARGAPRRR